MEGWNRNPDLSKTVLNPRLTGAPSTKGLKGRAKSTGTSRGGRRERSTLQMQRAERNLRTPVSSPKARRGGGGHTTGTHLRGTRDVQRLQETSRKEQLHRERNLPDHGTESVLNPNRKWVKRRRGQEVMRNTSKTWEWPRSGPPKDWQPPPPAGDLTIGTNRAERPLTVPENATRRRRKQTPPGHAQRLLKRTQDRPGQQQGQDGPRLTAVVREERSTPRIREEGTMRR